MHSRLHVRCSVCVTVCLYVSVRVCDCDDARCNYLLFPEIKLTVHRIERYDRGAVEHTHTQREREREREHGWTSDVYMCVHFRKATGIVLHY